MQLFRSRFLHHREKTRSIFVNKHDHYLLVLRKMLTELNFIIFRKILPMISNYKFLHYVPMSLNFVHNMQNIKLATILSCQILLETPQTSEVNNHSTLTQWDS